MSKYKKKTSPHFLFLEVQVHMYLSVYFHYHATDVLEQYLKWNWTHIRLFQSSPMETNIWCPFVHHSGTEHMNGFLIRTNDVLISYLDSFITWTLMCLLRRPLVSTIIYEGVPELFPPQWKDGKVYLKQNICDSWLRDYGHCGI